jgi:hypothetical protein
MISEISALENRVRQLELQNRFIKWTAVVILLLGTVVSVKAQQHMRTIEAEKFVLLDSKGHTRVTIGTPRTSGAAIDMPEDEPAIWISDERGIDRLILTTEGLRLANDSGRPVASLTFANKRGAEIVLQSGDGRLLYHAP